MLCTRCGQNLPNDANFCLKCGQPQKTDVQHLIPKYEACEVESKVKEKGGFFSQKKKVFIAKATGPNGIYIAAESSILLTDDDIWYGHEKAEKALEDLVNKLLQDGWEFVGTGSFWSHKRFRRIVR